MIVVLAAPSLADHVAKRGKLPPPRVQRAITRRAERFQRRLLATLRAQGVRIRPERSFTRTFNGFSAVLDGQAVAALERAPGVAGVYPVRAVYPASVSAATIARPELGEASGHRIGIEVSGLRGAGTTIALLDTGVDRSHPALEGRVTRGIDLVAPGTPANDPEAHGTRMAGILVGREPLDGVAPAARVVPIRVLAPRETEDGVAYAGRSDVLLEGIERAVDPDGDGAVDDAADVALAAVVEPYASFADAPEARAVAGALELGTLVVAPVGNDGPGAQGRGTVAAPAGSPSALAVGAIDTRAQVWNAEVTVEAGGEELYSGLARVLGPLAPDEGTELSGSDVALVQADGSPLAEKVAAAAAGGARAVLVAGTGLPSGALDLDAGTSVPALAVPLRVGAGFREAQEATEPITVEIGEVTPAPNMEAGRVAPFSSEGPSIGGAAKPELVAPGVGIVTADPEGGFATVTGSSAAAAVVAGAAALLREARPLLDARSLRSVLVTSASPLSSPGVSAAEQGAGLVDPTEAAASALAVEPAALVAELSPRRRSTASLQLRNLSSLDLPVELELEPEGAGLALRTRPARVVVPRGKTAEVAVRLSGSAAPGSLGSAAIVVRAGDDELARIPVLVKGRTSATRLVDELELSASAFRPSDDAPAVLSFRAGSVEGDASGLALGGVSLLEVELLNGRGKRLGVLARLRDLLPGRYAIGLTGRGPDGARLRPGRYVVRVRAHDAAASTEGAGASSTASVAFRILPG